MLECVEICVHNSVSANNVMPDESSIFFPIILFGVRFLARRDMSNIAIPFVLDEPDPIS